MRVRNLDCEVFPSHKEELAKARKQEMQCLYCPPNQGENAKRRAYKSWKNYRKTQYKPKGGSPL